MITFLLLLILFLIMVIAVSSIPVPDNKPEISDQSVAFPESNQSDESKIIEIVAPGHGFGTRRPESIKTEKYTIPQIRELITLSRTSPNHKDSYHCQRLTNLLEKLLEEK